MGVLTRSTGRIFWVGWRTADAPGAVVSFCGGIISNSYRTVWYWEGAARTSEGGHWVAEGAIASME